MATDILNSLADEFNFVEEVDENAMSTDERPVPPAGTVQLRLRNAADASGAGAIFTDKFPAKNVQSFKTRDGKSHLMLVVEYELVSDNPKINGARTREWLSSMVSQFTGTSGVDSMLRATTGRAGVGLTTMQKVEHLYGVIATEPVIPADIDWEGTILVVDAVGQPVLNAKGKKEYETAKLNGRKLKGMRNFPEDKTSLSGYQSSGVEDDQGRSVNVGWNVVKLYPHQG